MSLSHSQVKKLLCFDGELPVAQLGLSQALRQLRALYRNMPTQSSLSLCAQELNSFLSKYAAIMEDDVRRLKAL